MKILVLPSWYLPSGAYFIKEQVLFLQERGLQVDVLSNLEVSITEHRTEYVTLPWKTFVANEDGILTYRGFTRFIPKSENLNIQIWVSKTLKLFDKYIDEQGRPDLIHVHSAMWGGLAAALIKERYGIPYVITEHLGIMALQSDFARNQFPVWKNPFFEKAYQNADFVVPVSAQLMRKILEFAPQQKNWQAIPNIVDTDFFFFKKRERKIPFHFVCVNGYYEEKGYDILLQAFDEFCENHPDIELTIAGENFENPRFQEILKLCQNKQKIIFTGEINREQVRDLLWSADAFLLSSRVESQSIAALEAMSTGLPIVCTEVVPEFMTTDFCGFRVPIENPTSFAEAMSRMVNQIDSLDGLKISEHIRREAHKDVIVEKIIGVYRQILLRK